MVVGGGGCLSRWLPGLGGGGGGSSGDGGGGGSRRWRVAGRRRRESGGRSGGVPYPHSPPSSLPPPVVWAWGAALLPRLPHSMPGMCAMRSVSGWSGRAGADPPSPRFPSPLPFVPSPLHFVASLLPHSSLVKWRLFRSMWPASTLIGGRTITGRPCPWTGARRGGEGARWDGTGRVRTGRKGRRTRIENGRREGVSGRRGRSVALQRGIMEGKTMDGKGREGKKGGGERRKGSAASPSLLCHGRERRDGKGCEGNGREENRI